MDLLGHNNIKRFGAKKIILDYDGKHKLCTHKLQKILMDTIAVEANVSIGDDGCLEFITFMGFP